MFVRLPSLKSLAVTLASLVAACLLFAWMALPRIIQSQAEAFIAAKAGHRLTLDHPEFNPLELSLRIANLKLAAADGNTLLGFRSLTVDLSAASIFRRAWVFDRIELDQPEAIVVLQGDGLLNWSPLLAALRGKDEPSSGPLPRLDVDHFILSGGRLDFTDQRVAFANRIESLDLELHDMSTLSDEHGTYRVSARTTAGARVLWHGEASLSPPLVAGSIGLQQLELASLAPYFKGMPEMLPPSGKAALSTDYRLSYAEGKLDLQLEKLSATLAGVRLKLRQPVAADLSVEALEMREARFDLVRRRLAVGSLELKGSEAELPQPTGGSPKVLDMGRLRVDGIEVDLGARHLAVDSIAMKGGRVKLVRDPQGRLDVLAAWRPATRSSAPGKLAQEPVAPPWRYQLRKLALSGLSLSLRDESVAPAAELVLEDLALDIDGISENLAKALPLRAAFRARDGGSFHAAGQIVPGDGAADLRLKLADMVLKPLQPYLSAQVALSLSDGRLSAEGRATYGKRANGFKGSFSVSSLHLNLADTNELFLSWKSLASKEMEVTSSKLEIKDLALDGLDTKVVIHKDKSINVASILRKKPAEGGTVPATTDQTPGTAPFLINVERLRVSNGELDFADQSLALPFGTRIHRLRGAVIGLSSRSGVPGQVELEGQVDDYGLARAIGQMDFFNPTAFTDLKVIFRNVEMTRLTPYSATFAGRKIDSGKLSLDLEYKIKKRQLAGENQVIMDQLTLGERVDSPSASNLPLDLAIALLQDSDGRIDLGLPVSGSLDDPQFSYGALVWKVIVNVIGKIASAPFRAIGALLGGDEKLEQVRFETGETQLTPPEREKLVRLAAALGKRPGLMLTLHGAYADIDRVALQERQLRRSIAERAGQRLAAGEHPGPLSTRTPAVQTALESLYAERVGNSALATLKETFRKLNPGQLEQGAAGKLMSRLSGLMREEKPLSEQEAAQMKGADFHAILYERLRDREVVGEARLLELARGRAESAAAGLRAAGAPADRVALAQPAKIDPDGRDVPLKLALGAAQRPATPATPGS